MTEFLERLANMVRSKRSTLSISQEQLAEMIGKSPSFVGQVERKECLPSVETLYDIVVALNLNVDVLFYGKAANQSELDNLCHLTQHMSEKKLMLVVEYAKMLSRLDL